MPADSVSRYKFIHRMGPYYKQVKAEGDEHIFFAAVFRRFLERWPIDARAYPDLDFMKHALEKQRIKMIKDIRAWASLSAFSAEGHWKDVLGVTEEETRPLTADTPERAPTPSEVQTPNPTTASPESPATQRLAISPELLTAATPERVSSPSPPPATQKPATSLKRRLSDENASDDASDAQFCSTGSTKRKLWDEGPSNVQGGTHSNPIDVDLLSDSPPIRRKNRSIAATKIRTRARVRPELPPGYAPSNSTAPPDSYPQFIELFSDDD